MFNFLYYQQAIKHGGKINSIILICIREHIVGTEVEGDWVDGLVVALDFLRRESEGKKYTTLKIVLFRNILTSVYIIPVMFNLNYVEFSIIFCNSLKKNIIECVFILSIWKLVTFDNNFFRRLDLANSSNKNDWWRFIF